MKTPTDPVFNGHKLNQPAPPDPKAPVPMQADPVAVLSKQLTDLTTSHTKLSAAHDRKHDALHSILKLATDRQRELVAEKQEPDPVMDLIISHCTSAATAP